MVTTRLPQAGDGAAARARAAAGRAAALLLARQYLDGRWEEESRLCLAAMTQDLLVRDALGVRTREQTDRAAHAARSLQLSGGGWAAVPAGAADPAVTIAAYAVLRLAGESCDAYRMALAASWVRDAGGLVRAGFITRLWLTPARTGPRRCPRSPLDLPELSPPGASCEPALECGRTRARHLRAERILAGQDRDGSWDRSGQATRLALMLLGQLGCEAAHPALARGLSWLDQACAWPARQGSGDPGVETVADLGVDAAAARTDTMRAVAFLARVGLAPDHPAMARAASYLARCRGKLVTSSVVPGPGPAPAARPGRVPRQLSAPGSAPRSAKRAAAGAFGRVPAADPSGGPPARRGAVRLLRTQHGSGSWPGDVSIHGDVAVTAAAVQALIGAGVRPDKEQIRRAVGWLVRVQAADGSWPEAGASAEAVAALISAGGAEALAAAERGLGWLARAGMLTSAPESLATIGTLAWHPGHDLPATGVCHFRPAEDENP